MFKGVNIPRNSARDTLSGINHTKSGSVLNPVLCGEKPATIRHDHGMAYDFSH